MHGGTFRTYKRPRAYKLGSLNQNLNRRRLISLLARFLNYEGLSSQINTKLLNAGEKIWNFKDYYFINEVGLDHQLDKFGLNGTFFHSY